MRAAVLYEYGQPLVVQELELDAPCRRDARPHGRERGLPLRPHSLQGIHPGPMPAVIGHEGAGIVEQVGPDVTKVAPGDHVILSWLPYAAPAASACAAAPTSASASPGRTPGR